MRRAACIAAVIVCTLSGCKTPPGEEVRTPPGEEVRARLTMIREEPDDRPRVTTASAKQEMFRVDVTPYTYFTQQTATPSALAYSGAYTRFQIEGVLFEREGDNSDGDPMPYQDKRSKLAQLLVGLKHDTNFTVLLRAGEYEEAVSLLTLGSTSDSNGSSWTRDVTHNAYRFPWFQVPTTTAAPVPTIAARVRVSQVMSSGAAASALKATLAAVEKLSPQSTVVTKLGDGAAKARADAVDEIISRLFATKVEESQRSDAQVKWWHAQAGAKVTLRVLKDPSKPNGETAAVGVWSIGFAPPRASLFSDYRICQIRDDSFCKPTFNDAAIEAYKTFPQVVLGLEIKPRLTVKQWLEQETWWGSTRDRFSGNRDIDLTVADDLCAMSTVFLTSRGLNVVDSDLVTWSMLQFSPRPARMEKTVQYSEAPACKSVYDRVTGVKRPNQR